MKHQLEKWVNIRSGHPLRSRIEPHQDLKLSSLVAEKPASNTERGFPLLLVQMKDLKNGEEIKWEEVLKTRIKAKKNPNWLKKDQILFQPKGNKFGAFLLKEVPYWTVAAPHLYIIEINQPKLLLPEFLVWQINQVGGNITWKELASKQDMRVDARTDRLRCISVLECPWTTNIA